MALPTVTVCSASPQENRPTYAGELISSLVVIVERAEQVPLTPLTMDEVPGRITEVAMSAQIRAWYELQAALATKASRGAR
jgi:hypothetical protein